MHTPRENRVKIIRFEARVLIDIFNWWRNPPGWLGLPQCDEIPADAEVVDVTADWYTRTVLARVYHPSFEIVEDGVLPPFVPDNALIRAVRVVRPLELEPAWSDE